MPQMSPITWLIPIFLTMLLLTLVKVNLLTKKDNESYTTKTLISANSMKWKW